MRENGKMVKTETMMVERYEVTEQDYDEMRRKYIEFDRMMNGMQNYIQDPIQIELVDFLKIPDNDEEFKKAVLQSMMKERDAEKNPNDLSI